MMHLAGMAPREIATHLGLEPYQGTQIFRWIHKKQIFNFEEMTDLSKELRKRLAESCAASTLTLRRLAHSETAPGTKKALFHLEDGNTVESVAIHDGRRVTLCLSTQVGCAVKCAFCATGLSGFRRNLSPGEIAEQALHLVKQENLDCRTPNIVYMGMGEPFRNYDATIKSIRLLMERSGLNIGARKITVSTVGDVPGIRRFAEEKWQVRLSVSLHAATNELRSQLVPINRKYPLETLMDAVRYYIETVHRQVTFEWTLIDGINDSPKNAQHLLALVRDMKISVNLIPYNEVAESNFKVPSTKRCVAFRDALIGGGVKCTLRKERGQDISAACGQLRLTTLPPFTDRVPALVGDDRNVNKHR